MMQLIDDDNRPLDSISYSNIYDTLDKYYKNKNDCFRFAIDNYCLGYKTEFRSEDIIKNEIQRLIWCLQDKSDDEDRKHFKNMIKFCEDVLKFREYFFTKGLKIKTKDIFNVFVEVQQKNAEDSKIRYRNQLYDAIKERLNGQYSQHDIIKNFINYYLEIGEGHILDARCILQLPRLLSDFGFEYLTLTDELKYNVIQVSKEIDAESFEKNINSSYDDISISSEMSLNHIESTENINRIAISSEIKREVWRRDQGKCTKCGSRNNLEYDHMIPVSKGGSNTARNIELLCQNCNRKKSNMIL